MASDAPLPTGRDVNAGVQTRTAVPVVELEPSGGPLRAEVGRCRAAAIPLAPLVRGVVQA